ncbi:multicopper oxidase family protein [Agromyces tardus]|uniref:Multicopper oxidase family protein n=1 Tax=Agromyces tardus TaxID=2583849 RepID=A0A3M8AC57_9MICO|nr:multicopper oxidase family protein [Agromyces tardus]RNB48806.1 multicopper oxidase family protein [Agromyces tardus]
MSHAPDSERRWTRRDVLIAAGAGAAAVVGAGLVVWSTTQGGAPSPAGGTSGSASPAAPSGSASAATLREPEVLMSADGRLELTLTAALAEVVVAGSPVRALTYNGGLPGPTLRVRAGDRITLAFRNELGAPTNLHAHGLVVSPEGNSDNVFVMIDPGGSHDYEYVLGADHPPGVFWYHPHHHGNSAEQLFGGLYGAIIVEDETPIPVTRERLLVISDIAFDANGDVRVASQFDRMTGREGDLVMVNGQVGAAVAANPGDRERWRIVNACSSRYLRLRLDGQRMQLLGVDSGRYDEPADVEEFVLTPGNRADVLVTAAAGESVLRTLPFDRGSTMMGAPPSATSGADLLAFSVGGARAEAVDEVPTQSARRDLRLEEVAGWRTLTLAMGGMGMGGGGSFTIDGRSFDEARIDTEVALGAVEEWTIVNTSTMSHPFHLHVWPMQLIEVDGATVDAVDRRDVVEVPARGSTVVRIAFEGLTGTTVYHCHILDHEDNGMMGVIRTG